MDIVLSVCEIRLERSGQCRASNVEGLLKAREEDGVSDRVKGSSEVQKHGNFQVARV